MAPDPTLGRMPRTRRRTTPPEGPRWVATALTVYMIMLFGSLFFAETITDALGITTTVQSRARASCARSWAEIDLRGGDGWSGRDAYMTSCVPPKVERHQNSD